MTKSPVWYDNDDQAKTPSPFFDKGQAAKGIGRDASGDREDGITRASTLHSTFEPEAESQEKRGRFSLNSNAEETTGFATNSTTPSDAKRWALQSRF